MFTGIVEDVGRVVKVQRRGGGMLLVIECEIPLVEVSLGDSISVDGVCLTVTEKRERDFTVEVSDETLRRTTLGEVVVGDFVNLERALKLGGRLGGHLVYGHVDGVAVLREIVMDGDSRVFHFEAADNIMKYVVFKGSVTVDGVSLTVSSVSGPTFGVTVLPYTLENTTLRYRRVGDRVNVEVDIIGKYVEKFIGREEEGSLMNALKKSGFLSED